MKLKDFDFRVWDEGIKGYVKNQAVTIVKNRILAGSMHIGQMGEFEFMSENYDDEIEIELWTGYFDKNDIRIYEGDVVFLDDIQKNGFVIKRENNEYRVEFNKNYTLGLEILNKENLLIVGNIHENPELLKC